MQVLEDGEGTRYVLLKRSGESSLVRDVETGESRYLPNEELSQVEGASPLETAATAVPEPARRVLRATHTDPALGLLLELDARGPTPVRALLDYEMCESDLHGTLAEFRAAGLVEEATVYGERGYAVTETARAGLAVLRGDAPE
ncbi:hypothetical protein N0B31_04560 [Salinirubellus salinus]|uniref:Uncharacterized protein n=1 Tax=Salinirubellus salinus TaxID=1364945 RepID=A0A9E7R4C6_9EURY|nr:hypothetical protein [Salinirubellus salinus]UWM55559.1 hypothetical protein N0B31_04560 [Salinirubellus salinus]